MLLKKSPPESLWRLLRQERPELEPKLQLSDHVIVSAKTLAKAMATALAKAVAKAVANGMAKGWPGTWPRPW